MAMLLPVAMMAVSAVGAISEGNAKAAQLKGQAASSEYDAKIADINSGMAYSQGSQQEEVARRASRQQLGTQRVAIAESGTGFGGSNAAIMRQSTTNAEMDALNIRYGADVKATGYQNSAVGSRYNAALSRSAAKSATASGYLNATSAILSQGSSNYASSGSFFG